jgi:preprotein translocase subunit SecE
MVAQMKRANEFVQECWIELQRVTWPDWPQLKNATSW